jgi:hypothetical protein
MKRVSFRFSKVFLQEMIILYNKTKKNCMQIRWVKEEDNQQKQKLLALKVPWL